MRGTADMVILIMGLAEIYKGGYPTGCQELVVSQAVDDATGHPVNVPSDHPQALGGIFDSSIGEWVLQ